MKLAIAYIYYQLLINSIVEERKTRVKNLLNLFQILFLEFKQILGLLGKKIKPHEEI
jgi:hypothetical protein